MVVFEAQRAIKNLLAVTLVAPAPLPHLSLFSECLLKLLCFVFNMDAYIHIN